MQVGQHAGQTTEGSKGHSHSISSGGGQRHPHPSDRRDHRNYAYQRDSGDHRNRRDQQQGWRSEQDNRGKVDDNCRNHREGPENISLKEEMSKERMLILSLIHI